MKCRVCRYSFVILWGCLTTPLTWAQQPPDPDYVRQPLFDNYADFRSSLMSIVDLSDPAEQTNELNQFWSRLRLAGQIPYAIDDRVAFMYRGPATSVAWRGDFNRWGVSVGSRLGNTDVWLLEMTLPSAARSDYKLFLNNRDWVIDTNNSLRSWSGLGANSELRMPAYAYPRETVPGTDVDRGTLSANQRVHSQHLGYDLQYRVYTPASYEHLSDLPVVYVMDGHEYATDYLGSMPTVLDNLIADRRIRPTLAVLIDPRDPDRLEVNRRGEEYVGQRNFARFLAEELVPAIDAQFRTRAERPGRTILGTSLGGLNSMYVGMVEPKVFGNLAIQSPAFQAYPEIYERVRGNADRDQTIIMTGGTLGDNASSRAMQRVLQKEGYSFVYWEVEDGHAWGAWRGQLSRILEETVGPSDPSHDVPGG